MFIGLERFFISLAKARFELFLRDIPNTCLFAGTVEINAAGPVILRIDGGGCLGNAGTPVDAVRQLFIGMHAVCKFVDDVAVGFHHQRDKRLLALQ